MFAAVAHLLNWTWRRGIVFGVYVPTVVWLTRQITPVVVGRIRPDRRGEIGGRVIVAGAVGVMLAAGAQGFWVNGIPVAGAIIAAGWQIATSMGEGNAP